MTRRQATLWDEIMEFTTEVYACIDFFKSRVLSQFIIIEAPNLYEIWEKVETLCTEVYSLIKCQILATHLVAQSTSPVSQDILSFHG